MSIFARPEGWLCIVATEEIVAEGKKLRADFDDYAKRKGGGHYFPPDKGDQGNHGHIVEVGGYRAIRGVGVSTEWYGFREEGGGVWDVRLGARRTTVDLKGSDRAPRSDVCVIDARQLKKKIAGKLEFLIFGTYYAGWVWLYGAIQPKALKESSRHYKEGEPGAGVKVISPTGVHVVSIGALEPMVPWLKKHHGIELTCASSLSFYEPDRSINNQSFRFYELKAEEDFARDKDENMRRAREIQTLYSGGGP